MVFAECRAVVFDGAVAERGDDLGGVVIAGGRYNGVLELVAQDRVDVLVARVRYRDVKAAAALERAAQERGVERFDALAVVQLCGERNRQSGTAHVLTEDEAGVVQIVRGGVGDDGIENQLAVPVAQTALPRGVVVAVKALPRNVGFQHERLAEQSAQDVAFELLNGLAERHLEADTQLDTGFSGCRIDLAGILQDGSERLLAQHVGAVCKGGQALLLVQMDRAGDQQQLAAVCGVELVQLTVERHAGGAQLVCARRPLVKRVDGADQLVAFRVYKALHQS